MRLTVKDVPGVIASISAKLAKFKISINSIQQKVEGDKASVIFMLHRTSESSVKKAVEAIKEVDTVYSVDAIIRVEE